MTWLTSFLDGLYCKLTGCEMTGNINMQYRNLTQVDYINKVNFKNVTTLGNEIIWEIQLDN